MKKLCLALLAAAAFVPAAQAAPAAGDIVGRVRAVNISPSDTDLAGLGTVTLSKKVIPEVDFTYFMSPNLAAELILTYPQKHDVKLNGGVIGSLKHLPPTLTLQYHINDFGVVKPYAGIGVNYTRISAVNLQVAGADVEKNSFGLALQVGTDIAIDSKWSINLDVKKVQIRTNLSINGADKGTIKVDPLLVGVGVGMKF